MNDKERGLTDLNFHFALKAAADHATNGFWASVIRELEKALQLAHKLNGDEPEWRPRHGGEPRPITRDPIAESPPSPLDEDPFGDDP